MSPLLPWTFGLFMLVLVHALVLLSWRNALLKAISAPGQPAAVPEPAPLVSLVVPVRNGAEGIVALLQDLNAQRWPKERMEVLVVDDGSTDGTAGLVQGMARHWPALRLLQAAGSGGKKAAIATGVMEAAGEVVVVTDADARCGPLRVPRIIAHFAAHAPDLLLMPVRTHGGEGLLSGMQREEQAALMAAAAGSGLEGRPVLANGANMAFRRKAFFEVGGYGGDRHASGDDMFLLQRMLRQGLKVDYLAHGDVVVGVAPVEGARAFISQRLRWAGKMWAYRDAPGSLAALAALLMPWALAVLTMIVVQRVRIGHAFIFTWGMVLAAWVMWLVPIVQLTATMRSFFRSSALHPEGARAPLRGFFAALPTVLALCCFIIYAPVIALLSIFVRPTWKGRRI